jgi:hypothetical protein
MCNFKSAIITKSGDILHNPFTDSHEDLVKLFHLNDTACRGESRFVRVEYSPKSIADYGDVDKYVLKVDEERTPKWFDKNLSDRAKSSLRLIVEGMIISGPCEILCGGAYILTTKARVEVVKNCLVHVMLESSNVGEMRESSNVGEMRGSSKVGEMRESSNVGVMRGSSKVGEMWGSSNVGVMWGSSKVGEMRESSNVGEMRESSKVGVMWGSSNVGEMRESSNVGVMLESSNVGVMLESSKVGVMWESSKAPTPPLSDKR